MGKTSDLENYSENFSIKKEMNDYYYDYPKTVPLYGPVFQLLVPQENMNRSNTTPSVFQNEEILNIVNSDEEVEVDVESEDDQKCEANFDIRADSKVRKRKLPDEGLRAHLSAHEELRVPPSKKSKVEPKEEPHFEPETDETLSEFTPRANFRVIEEHYQYKGDQPGEQDRQFKCKYCRKVFRRKEEKKRHENSHLNIRQHKCRLCDKTFMRADHRNSHEKTHSKEKEFKCEICNKSFRRADEAKRHEQRQIHLRNVARLKKEGKL